MSLDTGERAAGESLRGLAVFAAMAGLLLGAALQVQQAMLWPPGVYAALCAVGAAGWFLMRRCAPCDSCGAACCRSCC